MKAGFAVIFLYRTGSLRPFNLQIPLESLDPETGLLDKSNEYVARLLSGLKSKKETQPNLLEVQYSHLFTYLHLLIEISKQLNGKAQATNKKFLVYLASAVSDFYVPLSEMAEHKIQSRGTGGGLQINLTATPKIL